MGYLRLDTYFEMDTGLLVWTTSLPIYYEEFVETSKFKPSKKGTQSVNPGSNLGSDGKITEWRFKIQPGIFQIVIRFAHY